MTAQCKLYFDGGLIRTGTRAECENEFKHRVAEYQMKFDIEYSYQKQQSSVYDKLNDINSDLMQGVERPSGNTSLSRTEITNKVNNYKKRFKISCPSSNNIVQPSPKTKRANYDTRKIGLQRKSSGYKRTVIHRNNNSEAQRIAFERKLAAATQDAETRSTRATQSAYQKIDNVKTGSAGDIAMRQKAANDRAGRQIGFGVSGEEKKISYKVTFSDEELKIIVKQYIYTKLKDNKYGFVDHIKLYFEKKAGFSLNELLVITAGNQKRNYEIIESYNNYIDRFTEQIINEACNELYYDWGVEFCEKNLLYDMALLSDDVYSDWMTTPPGWKRIDYFGNKNHGYGENGFYAALYENTLNKGVYCLAYRGTEKKFEDIIITDIGQGLGEIFTSSKLTVSQHKQAVSLVNAITIHYSDKGNIYITGHSLGGGLASIAGLEHPECETYTFNASGVIMPTIKKYVTNKSSNAKNIKAYSTKGDPLTNIQKTGKGIINIWGIDVVVTKSFAETIVNCGEKLYKIEKMTPFIDINDMKVLEQMIKDPKQIEVLQKIDYDFIPPSLGNHYEIPNSANMGHSIAPIVELYDKSKNGFGISYERKFIEQQRKYLERFASKDVKKRYKIQLN